MISTTEPASFDAALLRVAGKIKSPGSQPGLDIASWYAIHQN